MAETDRGNAEVQPLRDRPMLKQRKGAEMPPFLCLIQPSNHVN